MTDLHCHILPGIDDGAKDVSVSLELLRKEYEDGVRNIAFTSHFNSERTTVEAFLEKRAAAYARLTEALKEEPMDFRFKLGSEVYFSPKLCELDAKALCMGDTAYMLMEFPTTHKPHFIKQTLYALQEQGILPLIAHIERYPYVLDDPTLLYEWVAAGAYAQINAGALLQDAKLRKKLCKFISWGLVHVLSTDTHSPDKRPPRMAEGIQMLQKALGTEIADRIVRNGDELFDDQELDIISPHQPKKCWACGFDHLLSLIENPIFLLQTLEKRNFIMNYPVAYAVIPEEEKTYIVGSGDVQYEKLFNYFIGDFLRDTVKSDVRNAIWNSAKQSSFTPIANWFKNVDDMGVIAHLGYFYGFWHIWRDVKGYLG